jgi:hypothetical protein
MLTKFHPNPAQVIVANEDCEWHSVRSLCAHHRTFPEIRGEGETPAEAAERLTERLISALDSARSVWHRAEVEAAIEDVKVFIELEH